MKINKLVSLILALTLGAACFFGAACAPSGPSSDVRPPVGGDETPDDGETPGGEEQPDDGETPGGEEQPDDGETPGGEEQPDDGETPGGDETPDEDDTPGGDETPISDIVTFAQAACESASFEWKETNAEGAAVEYRLSGRGAYSAVDGELIRRKSADTARADIVGLAGGESYDFRITASDGKVAQIEGVEISAYDRSGYAHFNYEEGVGAYNDDGTLKDGAIVVYVTEATKNTVTAGLGGRTYTGIAEILRNANRSEEPVNVRIIGAVGAATWNEIEYGADDIAAEDVIGANGRPLTEAVRDGVKHITEEQIVSGGYNALDESVYSKLNGLTNRISYSGGEFDSYYNMCDISDAENVTVEGIGEDAGIYCWGFTWSNCNSVEVRNLTFDDYTEDACAFQGSEDAATVNGFTSNRIWIHHNTINEGNNSWDVCAEQDKHEGDGGTDLKRTAYVTLSYNHYYKCHKTGLVGGGDSQTSACITFHHNWYQSCGSRLPLARQANMHMYNNYYQGSTGTNMSLRAGAYAFIENCCFDNAKNPVTTEADKGNGGGAAKIFNCIFIGKPDLKDNAVTIVNERAQVVENDNVFDKNFDTNGAIFYYDEQAGVSDVQIMHSAEEVKTLVPALAGTLRRDFNVELGGVRAAGRR